MEHKSEPLGLLPRTRVVWVAFFAIVLAAHALSAQVTVTNITFTPGNPNANDVVSVRIVILAQRCGFFPETVVNGNTIRTTIAIRNCVIGPPGLFPASVFTHFGPVPAGSYAYQVYSQFETDPEEFETQVALVVADAPPPPIPLLDLRGLAALVFILSGLAFFTLRRH